VWARHHGGVPVGVVDVGSNTVRVLVTDGERTLLSEREMLRLGADIELHGTIPAEKLARTAAVVSRLAADAHRAGAEAVEVLITSPGRQAANGAELRDVIAASSNCPARILDANEEGQLAFLGALSAASQPASRRVAVIDVGGGSAQVVVGTRSEGPQWVRSIDLGSQRLTSRMLAQDPPGAEAVAAACDEVDRYLEDFDPPIPRTALAVGGSARALKRIAGARLGEHELEDALTLLAETPLAKLSRRYDIDEDRARTLAAGTVILAELQHRLGTSMRVVRKGLRDGAVLALAAEHAAAA
jgi:exopolyphosphatase / guanosine-5'-triphosphate,3'-diphosphate pyrophosphatase